MRCVDIFGFFFSFKLKRKHHTCVMLPVVTYLWSASQGLVVEPHSSTSPGGLPPPPPLPPLLSPPSVMSSSPEAAAAACGSTFCQLTSSENWRLNFAATVQPSRLLPLAAFSISAVATFRVPRPSGDGYNAGGYIALWLTPQSRLAG